METLITLVIVLISSVCSYFIGKKSERADKHAENIETLNKYDKIENKEIPKEKVYKWKNW